MSKIIGSRQAQYLYLVLLNFAIALGIFTNTGERAVAQIVPDSTLPNNSTVNLEGSTSMITGGTTFGSNLFHSFQEFSVPTSATAHFNNAPDIQNIISRVTGSSISNIDGLIRANGNANLFLINPNGIIFGSNASLNIGGSFFATTASSIKFADGFEFSANTSSATPLLTISVPIGLQFGKNPSRIQVLGNGQGIRTPTKPIDTKVGLRVEPNQTLALVGGDISLEAATLKTAGGRIELGSTAQESLIKLIPIDQGFSLGYDGVQNFGNIQLSQQAAVDASGEGGGDVQLTGRRVTLIGGSQIQTSTLGSKPGGEVVVNASESVEVIGVSSFDTEISSVLVAGVYPEATGNGGDLKINTGTLLIQNGGQAGAVTFGTGKGGSLTVNATNSVQLIGTRANGFVAVLSTSSEPNSTGVAGDLTINTTELLVQGGAQINAGTFGAGNGGNLVVNAAKRVQLIDTSSAVGQFLNGLVTESESNATGRAGDLTINTGELLVQGGSNIRTGTFGAGNGGNLVVNASERVQLISTRGDASVVSSLFSGVGQNATGTAGNLTINTRELLVQDGSQVSTSTFGAGNGGNLEVNAARVQLIDTYTSSADRQFPNGLFTSSRATGSAGNLTINTGELLVQGGSEILTGTLGAGNAGTLTINASGTVQLIGTSANEQQISSRLLTSSLLGAAGAAGDLTINASELLVQDGAEINTSTFGAGKGGSLTVNASRGVQLIGTSANSQYPSSLRATTEENAIGLAGNLTINTRELLVQAGAQVATNTFGQGKAGNLTINAQQKVQIIGISLNGQFRSSLTALAARNLTGAAGDLTINTRELLVQDGAAVATGTFGQGKGGNLTVNATEKVQIIGTGTSIYGQGVSALSTQALPQSTGMAGNLIINTSDLLVQNGALVGADTAGSGKGGSLTINATSAVHLIGTSSDAKNPSGLFTSSGPDSTGAAGNITINTGKLFVRDGAVVAVQGQGKGNAGNLEVNARSIHLKNVGVLTANTDSINADANQPQATINLRSKDLVLLGGSRIAADARGENVIGGSININTDILAAFQNSDITANSDDFRGGRVQIKAQGVFGTQARNVRTPASDITATGASPQLSGTIELNILETNPTQELVELPKDIIDVSRLIGQNLCVASNENEFLITGRGGLPNSPEQVLQADAGWEDWRILHESGSDIEQQAVSKVTPKRNYQSIIQDNAQQEIVEAQGWMIDNHGDVVLVANPVTVTPDSFWSRSHDCQT